MKCVQLILVTVFVIVCFLCEVKSQLTISGVRCGSKNCKLAEYCSEYDLQCRPCSDICNESHHNYQPSTCISSCQDYIHDKRYVRRDGGGAGKEEDLRAVVQRLQNIVTVTLTLTCITLLVLIVVITIQICNWKKNNNITVESLRRKFSSKKSDDNKTAGNGVTTQISGKPDLRLEMPTTGTQSENSPVTLTTTVSRRPAEDSALDYAYDNRAMSSSPSPNSKPHESNF